MGAAAGAAAGAAVIAGAPWDRGPWEPWPPNPWEPGATGGNDMVGDAGLPLSALQIT